MTQEDATHSLEATTTQTKPMKLKPTESNTSNQTNVLHQVKI
jgi:hypothetical protein